MAIQAQIPPGLAAVHNFIMDHDDTDIQHYLNGLDAADEASNGQLGDGTILPVEHKQASILCDQIARQMWHSYQHFLQDHPEILEGNFVVKTDQLQSK
jgi:hypothetical protein